MYTGKQRVLGDMADNACPDFMLFRVEAQLEDLIELSETTDMEIDPIVFGNLNKVAQRTLTLHKVPSGVVGCPSHEVPMEAVENYLLTGLTVHNIVHRFGVGERTVYSNGGA